MNEVATQLHGYRHGHQLLDGEPLSKGDQSVLDRLSDLSGPLRPSETFAPYVTSYPLPSGNYYVLARTWQDLAVSRAGCVRTLSLIVPMKQWVGCTSVKRYFDLLPAAVMPETAAPAVAELIDGPVEPVLKFDGRELLEALFLEDTKPIVVFDPPEPEQIAVRLLSALWPDLRERFSISTFALSPRKTDSGFFDVVFAPKDAKSRFTNWAGRRIDARSETSTRHRWTSMIVDRVFRDPNPSLLDVHDLSALNRNELSAPSALRISLLWRELLGKLEASPSAALGLLDVANSKFSDWTAVAEVMPLLISAAIRSASEMEPSDSWALVTAMLRKIQNTSFSAIEPDIAAVGRTLTLRAPGRAISVLEQPDPNGTYESLLPSIAAGLREGFQQGAEQALAASSPETLIHVLEQDQSLASMAVESPALLRRLAEALPSLSASAFENIRATLLPLLCSAEHLPLARAFLPTLSAEGLLSEVDHLAVYSDVPDDFAREVVTRAKALENEDGVREKALSLEGTFAHQLLKASLGPYSGDVRWLLDHLPAERSRGYVADLFTSANDQQLSEMLSDDELARRAISTLGSAEATLLLRIATEVWISIDLLVSVVKKVRGTLSNSEVSRLLKHAAQRCLREHFENETEEFLCELLDIDPTVNADWLIHQGLAGHLESSLVSRNLRVFDRLTPKLRDRIVASVDSIADALSARWTIDIDDEAADALSNILAASEHGDRRTTLRAAGLLLPALIRSRDWPISPVIVVTFPHVYAELAREDDVPDLFRFVPFLDWDRCKAARHELVDAFLSADAWRPSDFAYTAWRCNDLDRFIKRLIKQTRGPSYLSKIEEDLSSLPGEATNGVSQAIIASRREHNRT